MSGDRSLRLQRRRSSTRRGRPSRKRPRSSLPSCPSKPTWRLRSPVSRLPHVRRAGRGARRRRRPRRDRRGTLAGRAGEDPPARGAGHDAFVVRFQQTTPPVHAKGVEDTAFYRWNRFVALNEVGGDPGRFSLSVESLPRGQPRAPARRPARDDDPRHEAKRGSAGTARLHRSRSGRVGARSCGRGSRAGAIPNEAYLILQTVVGAWPLDTAIGSGSISRRRCARRR